MRLLLALLCTVVAGGACASTLTVHLGDMSGFTRLTVEPSRQAKLHIEHDGDRVSVSLAPAGKLAVSIGQSRFVKRRDISSGMITYTFSQRVSVRQLEQGRALWVDVFPAVQMSSAPSRSTSTLGSAGRPPSALNTQAAGTLIPGLPTAFEAKIENTGGSRHPSIDIASSQAKQSVSNVAGPNATKAAAQTVQEQLQVSSMPHTGDVAVALLPFSSDVGVAILRHAGEAIIFFDEARPLDFSPFRTDPTLSGASVSIHANSTQIRVPLDPAQCINLTRQRDGWQLGVSRDPPDVTPIPLSLSGPELHFQMKAPGRVIDAIDPVTGSYLLVGTDRLAHSAVRLTRRSATFAIDRTEFGVVVEPISDRLTLRPVEDGFALARDDSESLNAKRPDRTGDGLPDPAGLTRSLDIEAASIPGLMDRLHAQLFAAATDPERARLQPRLSAAQTMLALGLTREARSLIRVAFADHPLAGADPKALLVRAICEFLNDPRRADLLDDPALPASDEAHLWRALAGPAGSFSLDGQAATVRAGMRLLLAYPEGLRDIAAGLAAPILLAHATRADRDALAALPQIPNTRIEHALADDQAGERGKAITELDLLTRSQDLGVSSKALLALLRLEGNSGHFRADSAADLLDRHRLDFRAVGREAEGLLAEAQFRLQSEQFARAFALWNEISTRFPDHAAEAHARMADFLNHLADPAIANHMTAADFVTVVTQSAPELLADQDSMAHVAPILAERLEDLDLPGRAASVLQTLVEATPPTSVKAKLGNRLAELRLAQGEIEQAQEALDRSTAPDLPDAVVEARQLTLARILDRSGEHTQALAVLANDQSDASHDLRAAIEATLGRWHEAKIDLGRLASQIPGSGGLTREEGEIAIRLATAASRDKDLPLLTSLSRSVSGRFIDSGQQDTFNLLTTALIPDAVASNGRGG